MPSLVQSGCSNGCMERLSRNTNEINKLNGVKGFIVARKRVPNDSQYINAKNSEVQHSHHCSRESDKTWYARAFQPILKTRQRNFHILNSHPIVFEDEYNINQLNLQIHVGGHFIPYIDSFPNQVNLSQPSSICVNLDKLFQPRSTCFNLDQFGAGEKHRSWATSHRSFICFFNNTVQSQTFQLSRILRETHAFDIFLTLTHLDNTFSRCHACSFPTE